jgi:hypothetical protein
VGEIEKKKRLILCISFPGRVWINILRGEDEGDRSKRHVAILIPNRPKHA